MKIRIIAPVTNQTLKTTTPQICAEKARPDVEVSAVNLDHGPASIESFYEDALAVPQIITRAIEAEREGVDAVIIDCMNDPGLEAVREAVSIPVVGAAQSSMMLASILAHKFSILGLSARDRYMVDLLVRRYGLKDSYASTRWVDIPVLDLRKDREKLLAALVDESAKAIRQDGAHAIVFGCTGMKGMAGLVEQKLRADGLDAIVIDPSLAALKWAEMLADIKLTHSRRTYPKAQEKLLNEHQIATVRPVPGIPGLLHNNPELHVLEPVTQGDRDSDWLEVSQQDYARFARNGTTIHVAAIKHGAYSIEMQYEKHMSVPEMLSLARGAERGGASAIIIDCMGDPGLVAIREAVNIPVVGPAQTSAFVAASLAHRFSIIGTSDNMVHKFQTQMDEYGISSKLASVRGTGIPAREVERNQDQLVQAFIREAELAVTQDGAHIIIPGCTGMIGLAASMQKALEARGIHVPVIEPPAVAVKMAEALSDLGLAQSKLTYPLPPKKELAGYSHLEIS